MSDQPDLTGNLVPGAPQCGCDCHNFELGNVLAEIDWNGDPQPNVIDEEHVFWRDNPRFVDRRTELDAATACSKCSPKHALALSTDPSKAYEDEMAKILPPTPVVPLGGPNGRCQPDCPFCKRRDSIKEDHL